MLLQNKPKDNDAESGKSKANYHAILTEQKKERGKASIMKRNKYSHLVISVITAHKIILIMLYTIQAQTCRHTLQGIKFQAHINYISVYLLQLTFCKVSNNKPSIH